jgi:hypothetical protein
LVWLPTRAHYFFYRCQLLLNFQFGIVF